MKDIFCHMANLRKILIHDDKAYTHHRLHLKIKTPIQRIQPICNPVFEKESGFRFHAEQSSAVGERQLTPFLCQNFSKITPFLCQKNLIFTP